MPIPESKESNEGGPMNISVQPSSTDVNGTASIEALLKDTANHLNESLRTHFSRAIQVQIASSNPRGPITLNRNCRNDPLGFSLLPADNSGVSLYFSSPMSSAMC